MKQQLWVWFMVMLLSVGGCSWFDKGKPQEKTADELINEGMHEFDAGNYKKASESFQKLKEWYPFSKYSSLAELKMADSFFRMEEYENADLAYQEFENLHPRNEAVPYVVYQMGLCHFNQMDSVDRDQSNARKAIDIFNRLMKQFPDDPYSKQAAERIRDCQKSLAGHDFYVGVQYYKGKHYKSALSRFKTVISEYTDVGFHQQALQYMRLCEEALKSK